MRDPTRLVLGAIRSISAALACLVLLTASTIANEPEPPPSGTSMQDSSRPNIILIMADDLGYGIPGCYGQELIETPHIDALARDGMKFTQAYAGSHVCQPSRSVLMTGLHSGHTPVRANSTQQMLRPEDITLAEVLKSRDYATGMFGKWGLGFDGTTGAPHLQGFDQFYGQLLQVHAHFYYPAWVWENETKVSLPGNEGKQRGQYVQDEIHAQAMSFIRNHHDQPFFAYLPYIIPHVELVVPEDSEAPYRGRFPVRAIVDPREGYIGSDDGLTTFAGMISRLDGYVGEITELLDELEIADNTIVLFTSDNGAQGGGFEQGWARMSDFFDATAGLRGYKGSFYEGGIRVPLIVKWPAKISAGSETDHVCAFWDLLPTLAEAAGADAPQEIDGISFLPTLLEESNQVQHDALYWEYARRGGIERALRAGDWKLIAAPRNGSVELYHLQRDPSETNDVASEHPEIVRTLLEQMDASRSEPPDWPVVQVQSGIDAFVR